MKKIILAIGLVLLCSVVHAGTIRHDRLDSSYTDLASDYTSIGELLWPGYLASGTLVAPNWVLTAAHTLDGGMSPGSYTFDLTDSGGGTYTGEEIFIHPGWTGDLEAGYDIGLLKLSQRITDITPAVLNTQTNEVGKTGTHVGYGETGDGLTGSIKAAGTKRAGRNTVDATGSEITWSNRILLTDFDNPEHPDDSFLGATSPLDLEYMIAPGDSGGGLFIDFGDGAILAGIHSFIAWSDEAGDSDYGDLSGSTRISSFVDWINDTTAVPIPGTIWVFGSGLLALLGLVNRSRTG